MKGKNILLLGAGHGHLYTIRRIRELVETGCTVRVINASRYHYYSGMGPGMLGGRYMPEDIRFDIARMVDSSGGYFIEDAVEKIDPVQQVVSTANGRRFEYDILSCNLGSVVRVPFAEDIPDNVYTVKPIRNLQVLRQKMEQFSPGTRLQPVIAGGGPAGVEVAANMKQRARQLGLDAEVILVTAGTVLEGFPSKAVRKARERLEGMGVLLREQRHVTGINDKNVFFKDEDPLPFDYCIMATGIVPPPVFTRSGLDTGPDGGLVVNEYLQSVQYPGILGTGDCIFFSPRSLARAGVHAVRQGPVLYNNIHALVRGLSLKPFRPQKKYLLIMNLAGLGVAARGKLACAGKVWFKIKDIIDRRYMKKIIE